MARNARDTGSLLAGRYRLVEPLRPAAVGSVWLANDEVADRPVAVEEILVPAGVPAAAVRREASAAARLNHPGLARVLDLVEGDDRPWLVTEFAAGSTLQQLLATHGPLTERQTARVGLRVLDALEAARAGGLEAADVRPSTVLLADDGRVVLTGVGVTRHPEQPAPADPYRPPDRVGGGPGDGLRSALWSLGATLYAAAHGRAPDPSNGAVPAGPAGLAPALAGLLEPDPARRLPAAEAVRLLRQVIDAVIDAAAGGQPNGAGHADAQAPPESPGDVGIRSADDSTGEAAVQPSPAHPGTSTAGTPPGEVFDKELTAALAAFDAALGVLNVDSARRSATPDAAPAAADPAEQASAGTPGDAVPSTGAPPAVAGQTTERAATGTPDDTVAAPRTPSTTGATTTQMPDTALRAPSGGTGQPPEPTAAGTPPGAPDSPQGGAAAAAVRAPASGAGQPPEPTPAGTPPGAADGPQGGAAAAAVRAPSGGTGQPPEPTAAGTPPGAADSPQGGAAAAALRAPSGGTGQPPEPTAAGTPPGAADGPQGRAAAGDQAGAPPASEPAPAGTPPARVPPGAARGPGQGAGTHGGAAIRSGAMPTAGGGAQGRRSTGTAARTAVPAGTADARPHPAPQPVPPQRPAPAGRPRRSRRGAVIAAIAIAVAAAIVAVLVVLAGDGDETAAPTPTSNAGLTAAASSINNGRVPPTVLGTPSPAAADPVPSGWRLYRDPAGFSVGVPADWRQGRDGAAVTFRDPRSDRQVRIEQRPSAGSDPYDQALAQQSKAAGRIADYDLIRIARVMYRGWPTADWEYRARVQGVRSHVLVRSVVPAGTRTYSISWSTSDSRWAADRKYFDTVVGTFSPAP